MLYRTRTTQITFAEMTGYDHTTINRMANGKAKIPRTVAIVAHVLDIRHRYTQLLERMPESDPRRLGISYVVENLAAAFDDLGEHQEDLPDSPPLPPLDRVVPKPVDPPAPKRANG